MLTFLDQNSSANRSHTDVSLVMEMYFALSCSTVQPGEAFPQASGEALCPKGASVSTV